MGRDGGQGIRLEGGVGHHGREPLRLGVVQALPRPQPPRAQALPGAPGLLRRPGRGEVPLDLSERETQGRKVPERHPGRLLLALLLLERGGGVSASVSLTAGGALRNVGGLFEDVVHV